MAIKWMAIFDIWMEWLKQFLVSFCLEDSHQFYAKRKYGLEDVVWRIPRWLLSAWSSLISKLKDLGYSECQEGINFGRCCLKKPMKAEKVRGHLWYLNGMKETFLSLFLAWFIQSSFCSWRQMFVWRKKSFVEFQDSFSVDGHLPYLNGMI